MNADNTERAFLARYARHILIPEVGIAGQRALQASRVLCVGAGGLGSPVMTYLAAAGVGTIGVIDHDHVDESNLQRQIIHREASLGRLKTESAAQTIGSINSTCTVEQHATRLTAENARTIFSRYDVIVDGADNFSTRYIVNDAAVLERKPYVWASVFRFEGQVSVFDTRTGPCYRCLYSEAPPPGLVPSCAEGGVFGAVCGMMGTIQATEVLKLILGIGEPLTGRLLLVDALNLRHQELAIKRRHDCELCGPSPTITQVVETSASCTPSVARPHIRSTDLKSRLDAGEAIDLIDVREPAEAEIIGIAGARLVPKGTFLKHEDPASLVSADRPVIVFCKSGARSAEVLDRLHAVGRTDVVHLEGGILEWIRSVDQEAASY